jgi:hypothetical protein
MSVDVLLGGIVAVRARSFADFRPLRMTAFLGFGGDFKVLAGWRALLAWTGGGGCPHVVHILEGYDYYRDRGQS